jgi:ubiquinol-cytochrome c reductase iron-sulfur subunit
MLWLAVAGIVYIFISAIRSGNGEVPSVPSLKVGIGDLQSGQARLLTWEGRPVILYRRQDSDFARLRTADARLVDPGSARSEQPAAFANDFRSESPELFVAIALGTDLGCSVDYLPPSEEPFQGQPWVGGFVDSCRKARYDLAGRVYESQYATRNLVVPQYSVSGDTLVLGR